MDATREQLEEEEEEKASASAEEEVEGASHLLTFMIFAIAIESSS